MNQIKTKFRSLTQTKLINLRKKRVNKNFSIKSMVVGKKNMAGKNSSGKITVFHRGNGHKRKYRIRLLIEISRQTIQIFLEFGVGGHSISVQVLIPTDS